MVGYIGRQAVNGNFIKLDSITTSATTTFNLLNGGVAYSPESARNCIVSLNGVIQSPETAYNIVNNTIVVSETVASSDVIDHIIVLGDVNALATVSDGTVSTAKIVDDAVTEAKLNLISTSSVPSLEAKGDGGSQDGYIQLNCSQNSHGIKIKSAPHSANASYTLTLPNNDGDADQFLKTNGSGVLSFADAGGGGKVLQVVSAIKTDRVQTTSTSATTTGLSVAITPSATSSKILLLCNIGSAGNSGINNRTFFAFNGGNTATYIGDSATGHECVTGFTTHRTDYGQSAANMMYLDSPNTTSATTYSLYFWGDTGTTTLNGSHTVNAENGNAASSITAIEIGA